MGRSFTTRPPSSSRSPGQTLDHVQCVGNDAVGVEDNVDQKQAAGDQGKPLAGFKAELVKMYGVPAPTTNDDDSDDGDE